jgi:hypothetical protein
MIRFLPRLKALVPQSSKTSTIIDDSTDFGAVECSIAKKFEISKRKLLLKFLKILELGKLLPVGCTILRFLATKSLRARNFELFFL